MAQGHVLWHIQQNVLTENKDRIVPENPGPPVTLDSVAVL